MRSLPVPPHREVADRRVCQRFRLFEIGPGPCSPPTQNQRGQVIATTRTQDAFEVSGVAHARPTLTRHEALDTIWMHAALPPILDPAWDANPAGSFHARTVPRTPPQRAALATLRSLPADAPASGPSRVQAWIDRPSVTQETSQATLVRPANLRACGWPGARPARRMTNGHPDPANESACTDARREPERFPLAKDIAVPARIDQPQVTLPPARSGDIPARHLVLNTSARAPACSQS